MPAPSAAPFLQILLCHSATVPPQDAIPVNSPFPTFLSLPIAGAVRERDSVGSALPLHLALEHAASEEVCLRLFELHPDSVRMADGRGRLPVALALEFSAARAVSWALMVAHPEGARAKNSSGAMAATAGVRMQSDEERRVDALRAQGTW